MEYILSKDILEEIQTFVENIYQYSRDPSQETPVRSAETLERCEDMSEILRLVRATVQRTLGESGSGIVLSFQDLPLRVGAYHPVGSNQIILNQRLLKTAWNRLQTQREMNSFIFSIVLHEYLHTLGYLDEYQVRQLVFEITMRTFGEDHPATTMARYGPWYALAQNVN